ncbi:uncharacterized protein BO80DRAFT_346583, partial [Aspergillus ibericus CBS 121593]
LINKILIEYLNKFIIAYIDNILIYSDNVAKYELYVYLTVIYKYKFYIIKIKFLKFIIATDGIQIDLIKIIIIIKWIILIII